MPLLVLLRHGQSTANQEQVYTGWNDVPLTAWGRQQALQAGKIMQNLDFHPSQVHTSLLSRAIVTANLVMDSCHWLSPPLLKTWRLNERHYGALRGINKEDSRVLFGKRQVLAWRRGFDAQPPALGLANHDRRYRNLDPRVLPRSESLRQTQERVLPYYFGQVVPHLHRGEDQLLVAHGSSLRVLIKYLQKIDAEELSRISVPNAQPIVYDLKSDLTITGRKILRPEN